MKNLLIILSIVLISCSKSHDVIARTTSTSTKYTLQFEMAEEENAVYNIQISKDGVNFTTIDTLHYDAAKHGTYTYDVTMGSKQLIRVYSINQQGKKIYSPIVQSK